MRVSFQPVSILANRAENKYAAFSAANAAPSTEEEVQIADSVEGFADWMNVSLRSVAGAFAPAQNWRLVKCKEFSCFRERSIEVARLLGIKRKWWSDDSLSGR